MSTAAKAKAAAPAAAAAEKSAQPRASGEGGEGDEENVEPQFRAEAKSHRDHLSGALAVQVRPLLTLVRRRGAAQDQLLDLRLTRGRAVLLTSCTLAELAASPDDEELRLHVEELNALQEQFRETLLVVALQAEVKSELWRKRSRASKALALRKTRNVMEKLDLSFQVSRPVSVDGPDALPLVKFLKAQAKDPADMSSRFGTYFVLDSTGGFYGRRNMVFPADIAAELESLCCSASSLTTPFAHEE